MKRSLILAIVLLISSCIFAQTRDTIHFERITGLIRIPVVVNGEVHYYMFDSGAEQSVIREDGAAKLEKAAGFGVRMKDSQDNVTWQPKYLIPSLKIGSSEISDLKVVSFPDSPLFHCMGIEGVIGVDIIRQFDWLIDFDKQYIVKMDVSDTLKALKDFVSLDFYTRRLRPMIKLKTGSKVIDYLFDCGANVNGIEKKSYKKVKGEIIKSYDEVSASSGASSFFNQSNETAFVIATQPDPSATTTYNAMFNTISEGENKIGNEFWGRNQVFLSWTKSKLLFRPANPEKEKTFGVFFRLIDSALVVTSMTFTDPIIKTGLKAGDKVKSINGRTFKDSCELITYQFLSKEETLVIEAEDGRKFTLKRESQY